jgi:hypothetical protein
VSTASSRIQSLRKITFISSHYYSSKHFKRLAITVIVVITLQMAVEKPGSPAHEIIFKVNNHGTFQRH